MKNFKYWILLAIITYAFIELSSYGGLFLLHRFRQINYEPADTLLNDHARILRRFLKGNTGYYSFSPTLGWTIKENGATRVYQANSSGIRSNREYVFDLPRGLRRVSTFGDSFTHGDRVKNHEAWPALVESYDPNMEVLNFGVGGYGLDQVYLRYLENGRQYRSHVVLIGFMSENIYRNVNTFRPFYSPETQMPFGKPRFEVKNDEPSLIPNRLDSRDAYRRLLRSPQEELSKLGSNDYYYQKHYSSGILDWSPTIRLIKILISQVSNSLPQNNIVVNGRYNEKSEAFTVTKKLFDEFYNTVVNDNSVPIILIFPNKEDLVQYEKQQEKRYSPLLSYFDSKGYTYIDLIDAFENTDAADSFEGHYSALANMVVAKHIHNYLSTMDGQVWK